MRTDQNTDAMRTRPSETAASGFHLPETLDWSSLSAQIKNRLIILPVCGRLMVETEDQEDKGTSVSPPYAGAAERHPKFTTRLGSLMVVAVGVVAALVKLL